MIQENVIVEVEKRSETGKNASNRYRASDQIPAVLYGGGATMDTMSLLVPRKTLVTLLRKGLHENAIFELQLKGTDQKRHVMIRDLTLHPITRSLLHVDFVRILLDRKLRVKASVEIAGIPNGVKIEGGVLNVVTHELAIECLPADIPPSIIQLGRHLRRLLSYQFCFAEYLERVRLFSDLHQDLDQRRLIQFIQNPHYRQPSHKLRNQPIFQ